MYEKPLEVGTTKREHIVVVPNKVLYVNSVFVLRHICLFKIKIK